MENPEQIEVAVTATVDYVCTLSEKDTAKVKAKAEEIMKNSPWQDDIEECYAEAVAQLYGEGEIDLYADSIESDFNTDKINSAYVKDDE